MYFDEQILINWLQKIMLQFEELHKEINSLKTLNTGIDGEKLLDNQDLCMILKVHKKTIERYRREGLLPFLKIKGKVFFKIKDVEACMKARAESPYARLR